MFRIIHGIIAVYYYYLEQSMAQNLEQWFPSIVLLKSCPKNSGVNSLISAYFPLFPLIFAYLPLLGVGEELSCEFFFNFKKSF